MNYKEYIDSENALKTVNLNNSIYIDCINTLRGFFILSLVEKENLSTIDIKNIQHLSEGFDIKMVIEPDIFRTIAHMINSSREHTHGAAKLSRAIVNKSTLEKLAEDGLTEKEGQEISILGVLLSISSHVKDGEVIGLCDSKYKLPMDKLLINGTIRR